MQAKMGRWSSRASDEEYRKGRLAAVGIAVVSLLVLVCVGVLLLRRQASVPAGHIVSALPTLNAVLNGTSAALLASGYFFIRRKQVTLTRSAC